MRVPFFKSLDRQFEIFGIKGLWVTFVLVVSGAGALLAFLFGSVLGTAVGLIIFILSAIGSFFGAVFMQTKVSSRQIPKVLITGKMNGWVRRRESLSKILVPERPESVARDFLFLNKPSPKGEQIIF